MGFERKSPSEKSLEFLDEINKKGRVSKWGLIKIAGNEAQFHRWIIKFLLHHKFLKEIKEGRFTFYQKTADGELFHETLKNWRIITAYKRISGKRLKREIDVSRL